MVEEGKQVKRRGNEPVFRRSTATSVSDAAFLFITAVLLGAMMGFVWWVVAPGGGLRRDEFKKAQAWLSVDMIFCLLSVVAGVALTIIFIRSMKHERLRGAPVTQTIVLMIGACLGACIAAFLGGILAHMGNPITLSDGEGAGYEKWFGIRSYVSLVIYPLVTAVLCFVYFLRQVSADGVAADFEE